jgi:hypothetical protein
MLLGFALTIAAAYEGVSVTIVGFSYCSFSLHSHAIKRAGSFRSDRDQAQRTRLVRMTSVTSGCHER